MTSTIPKLHETLLNAILKIAKDDDRLVAVLAGGSLVHGGFDEHSDLDLVIVSRAETYSSVMEDRRAFAERCGELLTAFTGEHVGESRLLICLFGPSPIHVDLKFVDENAFDHLIERPKILWTRSPDFESRLDAAEIQWPNQSPEWFEDRFWIWVHYAATKVARGELYEAIGMLSFMREQVLGPLIYAQADRPQRGVRRLEKEFSVASKALENTVALHNRPAVLAALRASIVHYEALSTGTQANTVLRATVKTFVADLVSANEGAHEGSAPPGERWTA